MVYHTGYSLNIGDFKVYPHSDTLPPNKATPPNRANSLGQAYSNHQHMAGGITPTLSVSALKGVRTTGNLLRPHS